MRVRNGLGRSAFLCVCFCSAGLLIVTQFAVCWYILLLKYLRDGTWQVKDSLSLGDSSVVWSIQMLCLALKCIVREMGQEESRVVTCSIFYLPYSINVFLP